MEVEVASNEGYKIVSHWIKDDLWSIKIVERNLFVRLVNIV